MIPASPNFICFKTIFLMRALPKGLTFGLCLYVLYLCNVHVLSKPWDDPVRLAGLLAFKKEINKQTLGKAMLYRGSIYIYVFIYFLKAYSPVNRI